ncbi:MAG: hypothetical protein M1831_004032 [Alyxoria varia]|nr:MAG: hypothetical protein M1831_004032 [Alyxoria varia]
MERVIRLPLLDDSPNSFVVIYVRGLGPSQLDLEIIGTEGEGPYAFTLRQQHISSLRDKRYKGDDDEWQAALAWALRRKDPPAKHASFVKDVELAAILADQSQIVVSVSQNVQKVKRRLGTISIERNDDKEIELYDWVAIAAQSRDEAEKQSQESHDKLRDHEKEVAKLQRQLDEFVKVKKEHEDEMLEKFRQLLNSKKLKIRDQQRLLAGAKVDSKAAMQVDGARQGSGKGKKRAESHATKRKAEEVEVKQEESLDEPEQSSSDEHPDDAVDKRTPEAETDTDDDSGDDGFENAAKPMKSSPQKKPPEDYSGRSRSQQARPASDKPQERELPYAGSKQTQDVPMADSKAAEDPDDDTDDEL